MRIRKKVMILAIIGVTASLYAQRPVPPSPAASLILFRNELQLSRAQIKKLGELDQKYIGEARPTEEEIFQLRTRERSLRAKDKKLTDQERQQLTNDRNAIRAGQESIRKLRENNREEAWKVLTPAQRTTAEELMSSRRRRGRHHRQHPRGTRKQPASPSGGGSGFQLWFR